MPPRLVRRRPLSERIKNHLNPLDFLLWISEELDSGDWEQWQDEWATPIGITLNVIFLIARANCGPYTRREGDDVFGEDIQYIGWLAWMAAFIVHFLTLLSVMNTAYTFWRRRYYRLFENALDTAPSTPSARRVRVDSSPLSSSPLHFLSSVLAGESAEARSHPDATRDVWELAVWDPTPLSLKLFCYLSPGHVLVYWLFLPTTSRDPRPSVTIFTTLVLTTLLSVQLIVLHIFFLQQSKDNSVIHKEMLNEYDAKFVHPRTRPAVRDVGTQFSSSDASTDVSAYLDDNNETVDIYKPTVIVNRGFHTRPNPNYIKHLNPDSLILRATPLKGIATGTAPPHHTPTLQRDASSPLRPNTAIRKPHLAGVRNGDGGSLGVYTHAHSPLRKAASTNFTDAHWRQERSVSPVKRDAILPKRTSTPGGPNGHRWSQLEVPSSSRESGRF